MRRLTRLPLILVLLGLFSAGVHAALPDVTASVSAPTLGRLFMTPERRAALERQRQLNQQEAMSTEGDAIAINGMVRRSSGRNTIWINQRPQHDNSNTTLNAEPARNQPGSVKLQSSDDAPSTQLKVGESLNRATQERNDVVTPGAIRVSPQRH